MINFDKVKSAYSKVKSGAGKAFDFTSKVISAIIDPAYNKIR